MAFVMVANNIPSSSSVKGLASFGAQALLSLASDYAGYELPQNVKALLPNLTSH